MENVDFIDSPNSPLQHTRDAPYHRGLRPRPAFPIFSPRIRLCTDEGG